MRLCSKDLSLAFGLTMPVVVGRFVYPLMDWCHPGVDIYAVSVSLVRLFQSTTYPVRPWDH